MNLSMKVQPYVFALIHKFQVFAEDNEDNALTALRIIFDLHKSFRPSLESHVQVKLKQSFC